MRRKFDYVLVAAFALYMVTLAFPMSFWYELRTSQPLDTPIGEEIAVEVDRTIYRNFSGNWIVSIYKKQGPSGYINYCTASGATNYRKDAILPQPVYLSWWAGSADNKCGDLPVGEYYTVTKHTLNLPFVPDKISENQSKSFTIYDPALSTIETKDGYSVIKRGDGVIQQVIPDDSELKSFEETDNTFIIRIPKPQNDD